MRRQLVTIRKTASAILIPGLLLASAPAWSARILLPEGTVVYAQLAEEVNSNQDKFPIGYQPEGHVWRDVVVGGITVIEAGTPIVLMISDSLQRGIGARAGAIEISAMDVYGVGGAEITLGGLVAGQTVDSDRLPIKLCGVSHCYRTEAGAHGRAALLTGQVAIPSKDAKVRSTG